jgi:hypothetical protein
MDDPKNPPTEKVGPITVDYEHLDVSGLMDQVKAAAARTQASDARPAPAFPAAARNVPAGPDRTAGPPAPDGPAGFKGKLKSIALKLMRPFFPLIRFLGLPLHQDIRATQSSLSETDKRLDALDRLIRLQEVAFEDKFVLEGQRTDKTELRLDLLEERIKDLDESMEYIRLLHTLGHNLVVELTKLRIEFDTLKSKLEILEKDFDYLRARERALEETTRS